jgi:hypothetical protein
MPTRRMRSVGGGSEGNRSRAETSSGPDAQRVSHTARHGREHDRPVLTREPVQHERCLVVRFADPACHERSSPPGGVCAAAFPNRRGGGQNTEDDVCGAEVGYDAPRTAGVIGDALRRHRAFVRAGPAGPTTRGRSHKVASAGNDRVFAAGAEIGFEIAAAEREHDSALFES